MLYHNWKKPWGIINPVRLILVISALFICSISIGQEQQLTRILFILDASNSMNAKWGSETRMDAAKELLARNVDALRGTPNLEIGLRVYGHQSPITPTFEDCNDTKLEVGFGKNNFDQVKNKVKTIQAKGTTPIARSLEAAAGDFPDMNARNYIILITDGLEACDGDPCVIATKLKEKGVKVTPFVIGLGMDLSYLEKFKCIGEYAEANSKQKFEMVLENVINKALVNTTAQIDLNDVHGQPSETNVTLFLYESGTKNLKYTFTHTLNERGLPDTLILDPKITYDLVVNTIPIVRKNGIKLVRNTHNTIPVDAGQGFIELRYSNATKSYLIPARIMQENQTSTLNVQDVGAREKYLVGTYDIEVLTLPRTYLTTTVTQGSINRIDISAPGKFTYKAGKAISAQIFTINDDGTFSWVCNLDPNSTTSGWQLQPGHYKVVYRYKDLKSTLYTTEKEFRIYSNRTTHLNL